MSGLASNFISPTTNPDGTKRKDITYVSEDGMTRSVTNLLGQTISIHHIGWLKYECKPSAGGSVKSYHITIKENDNILMERDVFSNIDLNKIEVGNLDYEDAVANTLLTSKNIKSSEAYDYIGELYKESSIPDGTEKMQSDFYTYKIPRSKFSLVFEDVKVEAAKSYKLQTEAKEKAKQEAEKKAAEQAKTDIQPKAPKQSSEDGR